MRRLKKRYVFLTIVLAGLVSLCLVRWHAWFDMPPEPEWTGPVRDYVFPMYENDTTQAAAVPAAAPAAAPVAPAAPVEAAPVDVNPFDASAGDGTSDLPF